MSTRRSEHCRVAHNTNCYREKDRVPIKFPKYTLGLWTNSILRLPRAPLINVTRLTRVPGHWNVENRTSESLYWNMGSNKKHIRRQLYGNTTRDSLPCQWHTCPCLSCCSQHEISLMNTARDRKLSWKNINTRRSQTTAENESIQRFLSIRMIRITSKIRPYCWNPAQSPRGREKRTLATRDFWAFQVKKPAPMV